MILEDMGQKAVRAKFHLATLKTEIKNKGLLAMADSIRLHRDRILLANQEDVKTGIQTGNILLDRLRLDDLRVESMARGLEAVAVQPDPVGEILETLCRPNGLVIQKTRVPIGVVGIIYEARPNVTSDAAGLCFKAGNAVILRGGKDAIHSNLAIVTALRNALSSQGFPEGCIQLVEDTDRETAIRLMRMGQYIDVLIPRGGARLIQTVVEHATVPMIETGVGNCHVYVDREANMNWATDIVVNAKTSRPSVCNAAETLLVHADIASAFLPRVARELKERGVEIRGCPDTRVILPQVIQANETDWEEEYLDLVLAVRVVRNTEIAIDHINRYGTQHSEAIVTDSKKTAEQFANQVDAAVVYVNASTRFTDGGEFGMGAEIGISTQKLHARGPMGLKELTSWKYVVTGKGQVR